MRRGIWLTLAALALGGCLEKVDPISNIGNFSPAGFGSGSVTVTWQPPTRNADGTPLMDLSGYNIYVGTSAGVYDYREIRLDNPGLTAYVVDNLEPGVYYITATALNSAGVESHYSGEIIRAVSP